MLHVKNKNICQPTCRGWYGEDEQDCQGDAGRAEGTHGAAAEAVQGAEGSALLRLALATEGLHLPPLSGLSSLLCVCVFFSSHFKLF